MIGNIKKMLRLGEGRKGSESKKKAIVRKRKRPEALSREQKKVDEVAAATRNKKAKEEKQLSEKDKEQARSALIELYGNNFSYDLLRRYVFVEGLAFSSLLYGDGVVFREGEIGSLKKNAPIAYAYYRTFPEDVDGFWQLAYFSRYIYHESIRAIEIYDENRSIPFAWRRFGIKDFAIPPRLTGETQERIIQVAEGCRARKEISEDTLIGTRTAIGFFRMAEKTLISLSSFYEIGGHSGSMSPVIKRYVDHLLSLAVSTRSATTYESLEMISDTILFAKNASFDFALWSVYDRAFPLMKGSDTSPRDNSMLYQAFCETKIRHINNSKIWYVTFPDKDTMDRSGLVLPTSSGKSASSMRNPRELLEVPFGRTILDSKDLDSDNEIIRAKAVVTLAKYFWKRYRQEVKASKIALERDASKIETVKILGSFQEEIEKTMEEYGKILKEQVEEELDILLNTMRSADAVGEEGIHRPRNPKELLIEGFKIIHSVGCRNAMYIPIANERYHDEYIQNIFSRMIGNLSVEMVQKFSRALQDGKIIFPQGSDGSGKTKRKKGDTDLIKSSSREVPEDESGGAGRNIPSIQISEKEEEGDEEGTSNDKKPGDLQRILHDAIKGEDNNEEFDNVE